MTEITDKGMNILQQAIADGHFRDDAVGLRYTAVSLHKRGLLCRDPKEAGLWYPTHAGRALASEAAATDLDSVPETSGPYQLLPPLSADEYQALRDSIAQHGVMVPVEYDEAGNILDGHHRVAICESLGLADWPRFVRKGLTEEQKRAVARELNLSRRHLSRDQKQSVIAAQLRETPSLSSRAIAARLGVSKNTVAGVRDRMIEGGQIDHLSEVTGRDGKKQPAFKPIRTMYLPEKDNVRELKHVAKAIRTQEQAQSRANRTGIIAAIAERGSVTAGEMPRAAFPVIYADPPWQQEHWSDETGQDKGLKYPSMPLADIMALCAGDKSPATPDAVCFLWVTTNRLADGIDVLKAWGFAYATSWVWDKVQIGMGRWVRDRHETVLIGRRGDIPCPLAGTQPHSLYREQKTEHSVKPDFFAAEIEKMFPDLPKLELFCRKPRPGWSAWGYESAPAEYGEAAE